MNNKRFPCIWGIFLAICFWTEHIHAVVQNITQPIGTMVRFWNPTDKLPFPLQPPHPDNFPIPTTQIGELNYICAQWDSEEVPETAPFDIRYPATEIILTQPQHFVRVLGTPKSGSNGAWIMRSEYVRGKTPAQIRDIFALPEEPIGIVNVEMPASPDPSTGKNYVLWTGIAGPIRDPAHNWGDGGSVQNRLVADYGTHYFPTYKFTNPDTRNHRQPIGEFALSYKPLAGTGNAGNVAAYLDTFIPQAYSDLENVYHALDYLNYIDFGPAPLQDALTQISPERFKALSFLSFRNAIIFDYALLDANSIRQAKRQELYHSTKKINLWVQGLGEFDNKTNESQYNKFHIQSGGIMACVNVQAYKNFVWGLGAAGIWNNLSWYNVTAIKAHGGNAKIGLYTSYCPSSFFIDGAICGGANWNSVSRGILFYGVNRHARSNPHGGDFEINVQTGKTFIKMATPILRLSYLFNRQSDFEEHGAKSLNLHIGKFDTHTLRTYLGVDLDPAYNTNQDIKIIPHVSIAWINDIALNCRTINAQIAGPANSFSVTGMHSEGSYFSGGLGCNFLLWNKCTIAAHYNAEIRKNFTAQSVKLGLDATF